MTIRGNRPIQYNITHTFKDRSGNPIVEVTRYGFGSEPSAFKVKMVAKNIERGIVATIAGLTFVSMNAERI